MDAFDELLRDGWTMQLYRCLAGEGKEEEEAVGVVNPQSARQNSSSSVTTGNGGAGGAGGATATIGFSYSASWWQNGASARVHRSGDHVLVLGQRKCLPAVEEAVAKIPAGYAAEIVVSPDSGAAFSILGPNGVSPPAADGDYLVCRVRVNVTEPTATATASTAAVATTTTTTTSTTTA